MARAAASPPLGAAVVFDEENELKGRRIVLTTCLLIGLALLAVVVGFWLTAPEDRLNRAGYRAIALGLDERQIEAVLGRPAGDYRVGQVLYGTATDDAGDAGRAVRSSEWRGNDGLVMVSFDAAGRSVGKTFVPVGQRSLSPAVALRRWLHPR